MDEVWPPPPEHDPEAFENTPPSNWAWPEFVAGLGVGIAVGLLLAILP